MHSLKQSTSRFGVAGGLLLASLIGGAAWAQTAQNIGVAATVVNRMEGTVSAQKRVLGGGDKVFRDELIETGNDGKGQLLFLDETALTVGPNSHVTLDRFVYNPGGQSTVVMSATRGVFRFVSGSLPSQAYEIKTPAGVVGVRGTIFQLILMPSGVATLQLIQGGVVWDTLQFGRLVMDRPGQSVTIPPPGGGRPQIVNGLTDQQAQMLAPIVDFGAGGINTLPDGKNRADEIRDQTRPSKGSINSD